jgi:kynurenine formamidase
MKKNLFYILAGIFLVSCQPADRTKMLQNAAWIDLTHDYDSNTVYWPTNIRFRHDTVFCGINNKGYFYSSFKYSAEEHGGTHFDAPLHFHQGGESIEKIGVERLHGPAVVIDVTRRAVEDRDYLVNVADLENWEKNHGRIPGGAVILLYTGWGQYYHHHLKYTGTLKSGTEGVKELHFPGLDPEAARWISENRKVIAIGLDTPSIDNGPSVDFMSHRRLCAAGITVYENVANLDRLPSAGAYIVALPMKIKGGSGAPLRIVAII